MKSIFQHLNPLIPLFLLFLLPPLFGAAQPCQTGSSQVSIFIQTDGQPQQTTFKLYDLSSGATLLTVSGASLAPNSTNMYLLCVPDNHCFKADLNDAAGDGGSNFYLLYQNQTISSALGSAFGYLNTAVFGAAACSDFSAANDSSAYLVRAAGGIRMGRGNEISGAILADPTSGNICIDQRNIIDGWVRGNKVSLGKSNQIGGLNNVDLFGLDYNISACSHTAGLPTHQMKILSQPLGNVGHSCLEDDEVVYGDENFYFAGSNTEETLPAGNYGNITVVEGATLHLYNDYYNIENLTIAGGKLLYGGGGGVLCDIFIRSEQVVITFGSTVHANINCDWVIIGDGNEVVGELQANDPQIPIQIGDFNVLKEPTCPPCQEALINAKAPSPAPINPQPRFKVWPNPVTGSEVKFECTTGGRLEVFDALGQKVFTGKMEADRAQPVVLDSTQFAGGMYIGRLTTPTGQVLNQKFMVSGW